MKKVYCQYGVTIDKCCRDNDCINCNNSEEIKKPPLGLKPRWIHEQQRRQEIISAMERYSNADVPIPMEWIEELKELSSRQ